MSSGNAPLLRVVSFVGLVVAMQIGSFSEQILGVDAPLGTRSWEMYGGRGDHVCVTEWFTAEGGTMVPFDRSTVPSQRPHRRLLRDAEAVRDQASRLCRIVGRDVRVNARCDAAGAWKTVITANDVLCQQPPGAP